VARDLTGNGRAEIIGGRFRTSIFAFENGGYRLLSKHSCRDFALNPK
jgi:hypothetical protein